MFEKEVDEIYELCKRVVNEVPTASITFEHSSHGLNVRGVKRKKIIEVLGNEFNWDLHQTINFDYLSEREIREKLKIIRTFLLELLIDGRRPLNVESDGAEASANNGTDNDSERASGGAEQAESFQVASRTRREEMVLTMFTVSLVR